MTPSVQDLEATSCCCSSTQRSILGLGSLGPLRLRVWGVLWGVLGLLGLWGLWVRLRGWCAAASLVGLSPCFAPLCPSSVPMLKLGSERGLAKAWPLLRAKWTASCLSWLRFTPQAPHLPCSLSLSLDSLVERLWTRRLSWRNADRSLESCKIYKEIATIILHLLVANSAIGFFEIVSLLRVTDIKETELIRSEIQHKLLVKTNNTDNLLCLIPGLRATWRIIKHMERESWEDTEKQS